MRSGVLTSVHAFATDPARGVFILITGLFRPISREGALLFNNLVMTTAAAAILLGTLYPLFLDAVGGGKISVGPPFFNAVFLPLMIPMIMAMAVGPLLNWKRSDLKPALTRLWAAFVAATVIIGITLYAYSDAPVLAIIGMGIAAWLGVGTLVELCERIKLFRVSGGETVRRFLRIPRATWGMTFGHLGMAIAIAGMSGAGGWKVESIQVMSVGETVKVSGYDFTFKGAVDGTGPNYRYTSGIFTASKDGKEIVTLHPEKRTYNVSQRPTTEAAIHTMFTGDLYVVIGDQDSQIPGGYVTRLYFNPLVAWMWAGALIMILGSLISLSDRRHRVGAPKRHRQQAAAMA